VSRREPGTTAPSRPGWRADLLACPACRGDLELRSARARCQCGRDYEVQDGIPVLLTGPSDPTRRQATWFDDEPDHEWEIERPHGAPALYRWLLEEKFRRAVDGVELQGATVLAVCAGSGMDAEFLARAGANVTALDISLGAMRRATERARRHGFEFLPVVGDTERLPFRDDSVDIVYVHDGLHHLENPLLGLTEMARVARCAICVSEPARAQITALAVRLGLALEREEAGNRVGRLHADDVEAELGQRGFRVLGSRRYGMYYRHEPGHLVRLLSRRGLLGLAGACFRVANAVAGRFGTKLSVVAVRPGTVSSSGPRPTPPR
jgi:SAM-dependent methyltransferase